MNTVQTRQRIGRYLGWSNGHQWEWIDARGNWTQDVHRAQVFDSHEDAKTALYAVRKASAPSQDYITLCLVE